MLGLEDIFKTPSCTLVNGFHSGKQQHSKQNSSLHIENFPVMVKTDEHMIL